MGSLLPKTARFSLLTLLLFTSLSFTAPRSYACSCVIPGTPEEELEKSDAVFKGKVVNIKDADDYGYNVYFEVEENLKGVDSEEVQVYTGMGGGDCGFRFEEGEEYLVYASRAEGELHVSICGLTALVPSTEEEATEPLETAVDQKDLQIVAVLSIFVLAGLAYVARPKKRTKN